MEGRRVATILDHADMKSRLATFLSFCFCLSPLSAQQSPTAPRPWNQNPNGMRVYLQAGLKTHQVASMTIPSFLPIGARS